MLEPVEKQMGEDLMQNHVKSVWIRRDVNQNTLDIEILRAGTWQLAFKTHNKANLRQTENLIGQVKKNLERRLAMGKCIVCKTTAQHMLASCSDRQDKVSPVYMTDEITGHGTISPLKSNGISNHRMISLAYPRISLHIVSKLKSSFIQNV